MQFLSEPPTFHSKAKPITGILPFFLLNLILSVVSAALGETGEGGVCERGGGEVQVKHAPGCCEVKMRYIFTMLSRLLTMIAFLSLGYSDSRGFRSNNQNSVKPKK